MKKGLLIYSGGMDSTCLLSIYKDEIALCITFAYGSKHSDQECMAAIEITKRYGIEHQIIKLDFNDWGFKSDLLTSGGQIPEGHYEHESMKRTVVPFRNGIMLAIATGIAESRGLESVWIANHQGDHAIYPDCRPDFITKFGRAMIEGTNEEAHISLKSPFTFLTKRDIALKGKSFEAPFKLTYSCYNGETYHCGRCGTCVERKEALEGFDETEYLDSLYTGK